MSRITLQTAIVLYAVARGHRWGFDVIDATGLGAGTVYPILRRLERDGLVTSTWESVRAAHADLRPQRRYYRVTGAGQAAVRAALERYPAAARVVSAPGVAEPRHA